MGSFGIWHWVVVLLVVLLLFGRGKIPELMGDVAKGIKSFKKGMSDKDDEPEEEQPPVKTIDMKAEEQKPAKPKTVRRTKTKS